MPNPSTYPYRRFPTIQVGAADHAARGTDAVKQELHALCAGSSKTVVTVECYADITRWEIQLRFRKGQDNWHTAMHDLPQRAKYKRGYFAEWRWGDRIKDKLLPVFDYYLDTTSAGNPAIVPGTAYGIRIPRPCAD